MLLHNPQAKLLLFFVVVVVFKYGLHALTMFICKELTLHFFCHHCLGLVHHHEITLFRHLQLLEITVNLASFFAGAALHLICMYVRMYACLLCQYLYSYNILYIYMFYTIVAVVQPWIEIYK